MSGFALLAHLLMERCSASKLIRTPEPFLVMDAPVQVEAFVQGGEDDGILAPIYCYHATQITTLILPGDKVLDLACGPATQLGRIARMHPSAQFLGIDASVPMLARAANSIRELKIDNVALRFGDMANLVELQEGYFDCVICTMSLHHLSDQAALQSTFREMRRVLKPDGGIYVADFGRLKLARTQRYFAHDRQDCQSAQFTQDYLHSLRAAFSVPELRAAVSIFGPDLRFFATALAPFMVIMKSADRRNFDTKSADTVCQMLTELSPSQRQDFRNLALWFRAAGFKLPGPLI